MYRFSSFAEVGPKSAEVGRHGCGGRWLASGGYRKTSEPVRSAPDSAPPTPPFGIPVTGSRGRFVPALCAFATEFAGFVTFLGR